MASYLRGSIAGRLTSQGRIGALAPLVLECPHLPTVMENLNFSEDVKKLQRSLARMIVGLETLPAQGATLSNQPFMMFAGFNQLVGIVLKMYNLT